MQRLDGHASIAPLRALAAPDIPLDPRSLALSLPGLLVRKFSNAVSDLRACSAPAPARCRRGDENPPRKSQRQCIRSKTAICPI